jgi:hypothetical protein
LSPRTGDPRALALADFLRSRADLFTLSAAQARSPGAAEAGTSLLEAADLAAEMDPGDPMLVAMSRRGMFQSMPHGAARVLTSDDLGRSLARSVLGGERDGRRILRGLVDSLPPWSLS